ncbi:DUF2189 domain-containing protein [Zavarzinia sp.]|uniref:DUF2189 domain-containing protein n=1 Tax=Zavarzinia sp. TaxID=2027920 RepID=UPI003BB5815C
MAQATIHPPVEHGYSAPPVARRITIDDLKASLVSGLSDYNRHMVAGLGFGLFYVVLGAVGIWISFQMGWGHMIFPALSGFLLFGPFAVLGLYEISRRDQAGEKIEGTEVLLSFTRHGGGQIALFGLYLFIATFAWDKVSTMIYGLYYGMEPVAIDDLLIRVFTTSQGFLFGLTGIVSGGIIAGAIFATSVFAVPMLLDRDTDVITAAVSSLRAVEANLFVMAVWGVIVCGLTAIGILAGFIGLAIVLPILGHATWHLYCKVLREPAVH